MNDGKLATKKVIVPSSRFIDIDDEQLVDLECFGAQSLLRERHSAKPHLLMILVSIIFTTYLNVSREREFLNRS